MARHYISDALCGAHPVNRMPADPDARVQDGWHKHRCDSCGCTWAHSDAVMELSEQEVVDAHTCPQCGDEQRWKHFTDEELVEQFVDMLIINITGGRLP